MPDLTVSQSGYETGDIDTARTLVAGVDEKRADHINGPNSAIIQLETILGLGPDLKGTLTDLVARLAVALNTNGTLKLAAPGATVGTGGLDGNLLIGNSQTGGWAQGSLTAGHGLDRTVGNGTLKLDTHVEMQVLPAGIFTVPAGVTKLHIRIWGASGGGGGGGGGGGSTDVGFFGGAGGSGGRGAAGGYGESILTVSPGATFNITIGAAGTSGPGGAGGNAANGTVGTIGGNAGDTSFATAFTATGGTGGSPGAGGLVGSASGAGAMGALGADGTPGTAAAATLIQKGGGKIMGPLAAGGAGINTGGAAAGAAGAAGEAGVVAVSY
jgi:hypothetical protein